MFLHNYHLCLGSTLFFGSKKIDTNITLQIYIITIIEDPDPQFFAFVADLHVKF